MSDAAAPAQRGRLLGSVRPVAWLAAAGVAYAAGSLLAAAGLGAVAALCVGFAVAAVAAMSLPAPTALRRASRRHRG